jgi:hypothetical protein
MLVALIGVGIIQRKSGQAPLAGHAVVQVGLGWMTGHMVFAEIDGVSLALALAFSVAAWGAARTVKGCRGGLWLLNGGTVAAIALVVRQREPLIAGLMGLLLFGVVAYQVTLGPGDEAARTRLRNWTGPWLMAIMLLAVVAACCRATRL